MSKRFAFLAASTALASLSAPALAQDGWVDEQYADVAETAIHAGHAVEGWVEEPQVGAVYVDDAEYDTQYEYEHTEVVQDYGLVAEDRGADRGPDHSGHHRGRHHGGHHGMDSQTPRLAYGQAERAEWLGQCRALHARPAHADYYYEEERDDHEGLIGGVLGAVVGGVIGNRVNDGDRLLGTIVGAGAGGLAGAVIGSVIDGLGDDEDERPVYYADEESTFDYCEAYLLNYERGYGTPAQMAYAPVMMVPVAQAPMQHQVQQRRYRVIEEEVEVDVPARHHRIHRAIPAREQGKLTRVN